MKIVVAGGAGFIGSHLVNRLLSEKHSVVCIDNLLTGTEENLSPFLSNKKFSFLHKDVTQPITEDIQCDAVFHLASPASPNHHSPISYHALPFETMMANTIGTLELLKLAHKNNARFLFASTSEIYGDPLEHPQKEDYRGNVSTTGPRSVYDEAKRFGETLTAYYWRTHQLDARIARIFNTYGPRMQPIDKRMIINFILQAIENKPITVFGDGSQTRSLCYVEDMVEGLIRLMFYPETKGQIINLGNPQEHTVLEYANVVKNLLHSESVIIKSEKLPEDDPKRRKADISKAKKILHWSPRTSLDEGLNKTVAYFKENHI